MTWLLEASQAAVAAVARTVTVGASKGWGTRVDLLVRSLRIALKRKELA